LGIDLEKNILCLPAELFRNAVKARDRGHLESDIFDIGRGPLVGL